MRVFFYSLRWQKAGLQINLSSAKFSDLVGGYHKKARQTLYGRKGHMGSGTEGKIKFIIIYNYFAGKL